MLGFLIVEHINRFLNNRNFSEAFVQSTLSSMQFKTQYIQTQFLPFQLLGSFRNYRRGINDKYLQHELASRDTTLKILFPCFSCFPCIFCIEECGEEWMCFYGALIKKKNVDFSARILDRYT